MKTTIAVFFGGRSTEHEISVISASQAMAAIDRQKYDVVPVYITKEGRWFTGDALTDVANYRDIPALLERCTQVYMRPVYGDQTLYLARPTGFLGKHNAAGHIDVVIPVLHGANGEDGTFQGILQAIGVPFAGCDTLSSANGMDKITMKMILQAEGIPVVPYVWFTDKHFLDNRQETIARVEDKLGYPVIVKPANLGSSIGISTAHNREQLVTAIEQAARYASRIIVEHMVEHLQEINCSVMGDADSPTPSVLEEPIKSTEILSYTDKYLGGTKGNHGMQASAKKIPAELPDGETERCRKLAVDTFTTLSCHGVARVDLIIDRDTRDIYINEINTIPGSLSFYLWEATGISFPQLMERLVQLALARNREMQRKTLSFSQNIFALSGRGGLKGAKGVKK